MEEARLSDVLQAHAWLETIDPGEYARRDRALLGADLSEDEGPIRGSNTTWSASGASTVTTRFLTTCGRRRSWRRAWPGLAGLRPRGGLAARARPRADRYRTQPRPGVVVRCLAPAPRYGHGPGAHGPCRHRAAASPSGPARGSTVLAACPGSRGTPAVGPASRLRRHPRRRLGRRPRPPHPVAHPPRRRSAPHGDHRRALGASSRRPAPHGPTATGHVARSRVAPGPRPPQANRWSGCSPLGRIVVGGGGVPAGYGYGAS